MGSGCPRRVGRLPSRRRQSAQVRSRPQPSPLSLIASRDPASSSLVAEFSMTFPFAWHSSRRSFPVAKADELWTELTTSSKLEVKENLMTELSHFLTIGEVAARSGVATSALRFYEEQGLISSERTSGNQRRYQRAVLRRVAVIRAAQAIGVSLGENPLSAGCASRRAHAEQSGLGQPIAGLAESARRTDRDAGEAERELDRLHRLWPACPCGRAGCSTGTTRWHLASTAAF